MAVALFIFLLIVIFLYRRDIHQFITAPWKKVIDFEKQLDDEERINKHEPANK